MQPLQACQKDWNSKTAECRRWRRGQPRSRYAAARVGCGISQRVTHTPPRDPAISLLGSYPGGIKACAYERSCTGTFIAALFTTAENSSNKNGCQQANVANPYNRIKRVNYMPQGHDSIYIKLTDRDRKQVSIAWRGGAGGGEEEALGWWKCMFSWSWWGFPGCAHTSKLTKLYAFYVCYLVCQLHLKNAVFKEGKASHRENPRPRSNRISNVCKTY